MSTSTRPADLSCGDRQCVLRSCRRCNALHGHHHRSAQPDDVRVPRGFDRLQPVSAESLQPGGPEVHRTRPDCPRRNGAHCGDRTEDVGQSGACVGDNPCSLLPRGRPSTDGLNSIDWSGLLHLAHYCDARQSVIMPRGAVGISQIFHRWLRPRRVDLCALGSTLRFSEGPPTRLRRRRLVAPVTRRVGRCRSRRRTAERHEAVLAVDREADATAQVLARGDCGHHGYCCGPRCTSVFASTVGHHRRVSSARERRDRGGRVSLDQVQPGDDVPLPDHLRCWGHLRPEGRYECLVYGRCVPHAPAARRFERLHCGNVDCDVLLRPSDQHVAVGSDL
mmetsp:Transcript_3085/g.7381  ORF Transcript_3085/g.7381 Transcript_3085/m.7381 type:complete len:335 (+) Transcript_3085:773-1777(+)